MSLVMVQVGFCSELAAGSGAAGQWGNSNLIPRFNLYCLRLLRRDTDVFAIKRQVSYYAAKVLQPVACQ